MSLSLGAGEQDVHGFACIRIITDVQPALLNDILANDWIPCST